MCGSYRLWNILLSLTSLLVVGLLLVGCGDSGSGSATADTTTKARTPGPTEAALSELNSSGVSGTVVYVKQSSGIPMMKIRLKGLERATGETQYFMWQMGSRHDMVSYASYHVPKANQLSVNLEPNPESLSWLEDGSTTEFLVTKVENDDRFFEAEEKAPSAGDPAMIGEPVARGAFTGPLVGTAGGE